MIALDIDVEADGWAAVPDPEGVCRRAAEALAVSLPDVAGTASLLLADDATMRSLNRDLRGQDKATNVLSFPAPPGVAARGLLGEIALGVETVAREAAADGKRMADHLAHLVVHGLLHLLGHDHAHEGEADRMEALEIRVLARLGISDPYREPA